MTKTYGNRYDVALVQPLDPWQASIGDNPDEYVIQRPLLADQTMEDAERFAEHFNLQVMADSGPEPGRWAVVLAPGCLQDLMASCNGFCRQLVR